MPKMKVNLGTPASPNWVVMDAKDADTVDGKHASDFATKTNLDTLNTAVTAHLDEKATATTLGHIMVGEGLAVDANGKVSVSLNPESMTLIASANGNGSSLVFNFTNIPQTYKELKFVILNANYVTNGNSGGISVVLNADATDNYIQGIPSSSNSISMNFSTNINVGSTRKLTSSDTVNYLKASLNGVLSIPNYTDASTFKPFTVDSMGPANATSMELVESVGYYASKTPITQLRINGAYAFDTNTKILLYGVK